MGHEGIRYSLPSRDIIAASIEIMVEAHEFDAMVMISSCDKIVPGMMMAAALKVQKLTISKGCEMMFRAIMFGLPEEMVKEISNHVCPGVGSCQEMYTANTMGCLAKPWDVASRISHSSSR